MITSFYDRRTENAFRGKAGKGFPMDVLKDTRHKLRTLHAAKSLEDLRQVNGNNLEALHRDRKGQHSIRINDQWRICFIWKEGEASRVEFCDYH